MSEKGNAFYEIRSLAAWLADSNVGIDDEFKPIDPTANWKIRIGKEGYPLLLTPDQSGTVWCLSKEAAPRLSELRAPCTRVPPDFNKITAQKALDLGLLVLA